MVDKGYTQAAYKKMRKLIGKEFKIRDLENGNSGMLRRGLNYGIITKVRTGWYRVADGVKDPWKEYNSIAQKIKQRGNPSGKPRGRELVRLAANKAIEPTAPQPAGPKVSIATFNEQQDLIIIGKRIWLAVEVALQPKGGK